MDSSRRNLALWTIACFVVGAIGIAVAFSGGAPISDGVPLVAPDGMTVTVDGTTNADLESFTPTSGTVDLTTGAGNATFFASGSANATVHKDEIVGPWTNVTQIDASSNAITVNPADKASFVVGGQIDNASVRDSFGLDDGVVDFVYGGASGESRVTIQGLPANTDMVAVDASTGTYLDTATSTGSGAVTFDALTNSKHSVLLQTGGTDGPQLSNPSPVGDQSSPPNEFSIDVNDSEFNNGDSVTVNISAGGFLRYNPLESEGDGSVTASSTLIYESGSGTVGNTEIRTTPSFSGDVATIEVGITGEDFESGDGNVKADIYIVNEQPDGTTGEGVLVRDGWNVPQSTGTATIQLDSAYTVSQGQDYTVEFVVDSVNSDGGEEDYVYIGLGGNTYTNGFVRSGSAFSQGPDVQDRPADLTLISKQSGVLASTTITSNQTVTASVPAAGKTGGNHNWTVEATDSFDASTTATYTYSIPSLLTIRNESNHNEIIDSPVNSTVTFYGDNNIIRRTTTDGTINMTGLPVGENFIVNVDPSQNFTSRTAIIQSIYEQQSVYLLNTSQFPTVESRFVLDDPTGQFGPSSTLYIQRAINISSNTTWQTIHADEFGVEGVTAILEEDVRYRIKVKNEQNVAQIVGPYRADVGETVQVRPGSPGIQLSEFDDGWAANANLDNQTLTYAFEDPDDETSQVTVFIHEKGNVSNQLQTNETYLSLGEFSAKATLTANESEKTWVVNFEVDRDGETFTKAIEVSNRETLFPGLPDPWGAIAGITLLLLLGGVFSEINVESGAVIVAAVGGILYYVQLLGGAPTAIGIIMGMFVAVVNQLRKGSGP